MTIGTVQDVADELGRPITDASEVAQVTKWLARVEAIIKRRMPDLLDLVAAGDPPAELVAGIEASAVVRKIKNPDGKVAEGIDDYNYRYNEQSRKGEIFLTDDEWALLLPVSASGAFSTRPGFEPDRAIWDDSWA